MRGRWTYGHYGQNSAVQIDRDGQPIAGTTRFFSNAEEAAAFAGADGEVPSGHTSLGSLVRARKQQRLSANDKAQQKLFPTQPHRGR